MRPGYLSFSAPGPCMHLLLYYSEAARQERAGGLGETEDDDAWCGCRLSLRLHARPRAMGARPAVLSLRAPGSGEGKPPRRLAPRSAGCVLVLLRPGLHVAGIPRRVGFGGQRLRAGLASVLTVQPCFP